MDDLGAELGMSKKTLYAHFESKKELLRAVILSKLQDIEAGLDAVAKERSPVFLDDVRRLLACVQRLAEEIRPPFLRDLRRDAPDLFSLIQSRRRDLIHRHFKRLFDRGRRAGTIRKDIPSILLIEILLGATEAIANPQKMVELGLTPDIAFSSILRVILEGVLVRARRGTI
jgi:AcrR family transcriptional regulator